MDNFATVTVTTLYKYSYKLKVLSVGVTPAQTFP